MAVSERLLAFFAGAAITLAGPLAHAADLCGEVARVEQPKADPEHPSAQLAYGVWERVYGSFYAVTGRATEIVVLADSARLASGEPFPPNAFICPGRQPGQAPTMVVTWPLITLIQSQKLYDVDFLALVLGHELGHRVNDFDWDGRITTKPGTPDVEGKADIRGAFFAAAAGYSTRRLCCDDSLDLFLNVEANVPLAVRTGRKQGLAEVLRTFDVYESLYDAAAALAFWDSFKAKALMGWVDRHLTRPVQPIPEFEVLAALTVLMDVADKACWTSLTAVPGAPTNHLRCAPVYPAHTAFWDDAGGAVETSRQCGGPLDQELRTGAIKRLEQALSEGADELVVHNALACANAYLGDTKRAALELAKAEQRAAKAPPAVRAALASNRAFIDWVGWMRTSKIPAAEAPAAERGAWAKALSAKAADFAPHAGISAWIGRLKAYPTVAPEPAKAPLSCRSEPTKSALGDGLATLPPMPLPARSGGCPCGWSELHFLDNDEGDVVGDGVRTCVPAGWGVGQRYIDVQLEREQVKATQLLVFDALSGPVASLRAWEKGCKVLEERGTGNDGKRVFAGLCPDMGAPEVVLTADDCRVARAVIHKGP